MGLSGRCTWGLGYERSSLITSRAVLKIGRGLIREPLCWYKYGSFMGVGFLATLCHSRLPIRGFPTTVPATFGKIRPCPCQRGVGTMTSRCGSCYWRRGARVTPSCNALYGSANATRGEGWGLDDLWTQRLSVSVHDYFAPMFALQLPNTAHFLPIIDQLTNEF